MKFMKAKESEDIKVIQASYDPGKEWKLDPKGYFLIRLKDGNIEAGHCEKDNVILTKIVGKTAEEVYNTIIREKMTENLSHLAYLGAELKKAEIARDLGKEYVQDEKLK